MLHTYRESNITFLRSPGLDAIPRVVHAFSTRRGPSGDVTLGRGSPDRGPFAAVVGLPGWPDCGLTQIHSNTVHQVRGNDFANRSPEGDATFTAQPGLALSVITADCAPVLVAEGEGRAVAAIHAGWRGTAEGIVRKAVDQMVEALGLDPGNLSAAIGPHIGVCCLEVGDEVYEWFHDPEVFQRRAGQSRPYLDLGAANRKQLLLAGVREDRIEVSGLCTRCREDLFHSHRRDAERSGRMMSVIGIEVL